MRRTAAIVIAATLLGLSGCGGASTAPTAASPVTLANQPDATVAPARTASPRPRSTATPRPAPSPTPEPTGTAAPTATTGPTASPDPTTGLKIAAPYRLRTLDPITNAAYEAAMSKALGSLGSTVSVGMKQVMKSSSPSGFVMVVRFSDTKLSHMSGFLDVVAGGSAVSLGGKLGKKTILGTDVRYASSAQSAFAAYVLDGAVVYAIVPTTKAALDAITAVIKANR